MSGSVVAMPLPDLLMISSPVFRGANVWHYDQAIQLVVDLGVIKDFPLNLIPGFADALVKKLPGLANHSRNRGRSVGFVERLQEGTWMGHIAEYVALQVEIVFDELASTRHAMLRSDPGDLVAFCVDRHAAAMAELESYGHQTQSGAHGPPDGDFANAVSDPDFAPAEAPTEAAEPTAEV